MTTALCLELIKGSFTLAAAGLAAWIALRLYFRQKEYELIKQRYLEGAIDIVAAEVEQALGVVNHNWARCLNVIKSFRDEKTHFSIEELGKGFLDLDSSRFHRVPHQRIGNLMGSQLVWEVYQLAMAFAANSNTVITKEIPEAIRIKLSTDLIDKEPEQMAEEMFSRLQDIDNESHRFASLIRELHTLGLLLESERLSFQKLVKISQRPEVAAISSRLKTEFAADLPQYEQGNA